MRKPVVIIIALLVVMAAVGCVSQSRPRNIEKIDQYSVLEVSLRFDKDPKDPFNMDSPYGEGFFIGPDHKLTKVPGFYYMDPDTGEKRWKIRFTPTQLGVYSYYYTTDYGKKKSALYEIDSRKSSHQGLVMANGTSLVFASGEAFLPIGENVAWLPEVSDYENYFSSLSKSGANTVRVIMVPWDTGLAWTSYPGSKTSDFGGMRQFSQENAQKLDRVIETAQKDGLYVILSLGIYGELRTNSSDPRERLWEYNPYNKANSGPCEVPSCFFSDEAAKKAFANQVKYILARYGYSPNILAFELWNEPDITDGYEQHRSDVIQWHQEMASLIKSNDPYSHLVTTSFADPAKEPDVWDMEEIGLTELHYHGADVAEKIMPIIERREKTGKPLIVTEFSAGNDAAVSRKDKKGEVLHDVIWEAAMIRTGALPWWWDEQIEENDLYYHFRALADFWKAEDAASFPDLVEPRIACNFRKEGGCPLQAYALSNGSDLLVFVNDASGKNDAIDDAVIRIDTGGRKSVSYYMLDTFSMEISNREMVNLSDEVASSIGIQLPEFSNDAFMRVRIE